MVSSQPLIINSPFEEPRKHWDMNAAGDLQIIDERRKSQYMLADKGGTADTDDSGRLFGFHDFDLVNELRDLMRVWRKNGYDETTLTTQQLLEYWQSETRTENRLFFCQLEAIETIIFLTETKRGQAIARDKKRLKGDGGPFPRWCAKMATGTGKTVVMAMLIVWHTLNRAANPVSSIYSRNFFIVAPGLTVKDRLQVLNPMHEDNYFDQFLLVPPDTRRDTLQTARVLITNWHQMDWETDEKLAKKKSVVKLGAESDAKFVKRLFNGRLPEYEPVVVFNDEAHHAWRVPTDVEADEWGKQALEEPTKWIQGLDRLHRAKNVGITACYDFTATPFMPAGKKKLKYERMFNWVVSDFGLNDAIEAGLVKTPRIAHSDNTLGEETNGLSGINPQEIESQLFHIFSDDTVRNDLSKTRKPEEPLPDLVIQAYRILVSTWQETFKSWDENGAETPPVMVSITNRTHTAARVNHLFTKSKMLNAPELDEAHETLYIDSTQLAKAEKEAASGEDGAEYLREQVMTIGVMNKPGEQIRHVIAVDMLSEGWDAKNVTHIMGLRPFTSQLLCEQVIGRGLRRTNYEAIDEVTGLFSPEHVRVFGVPFALMLQQVETGKTPPPAQPGKLVESASAKSAYEIHFPDIVRIDSPKKQRIVVDIGDIPVFAPPLALSRADMADVLEWAGKPANETLRDTTLDDIRLQTMAMAAALEVAKGLPHLEHSTLMTGQLADLTVQFSQTSQLLIASNGLSRETSIKQNIGGITRHIASYVIDQENAITDETILIPVYRDPHRPVRSTSQTRSWYTRVKGDLLTADPKRCHLNYAVYGSQVEKKIGSLLSSHRNVAAWIKNDREHIGFAVLYIHNGKISHYIPDFIARLNDHPDPRKQTHVIIEAKGAVETEAQSKQMYLDRWITAVNREDRWGKWENWGLAFDSDIPHLRARLEMVSDNG